MPGNQILNRQSAHLTGKSVVCSIGWLSGRREDDLGMPRSEIQIVTYRVP